VKVAFYTLGCKLNFCETLFMEEQFRRKGWSVVEFAQKADVYIVNTCCVTATAEAKSRKAVRRAKRRNPKSLVTAVGCYPQAYPEEVSKVAEADFVVGNAEKPKLSELVEMRRRNELPRVCIRGLMDRPSFYSVPVTNYHRARAFIKVQQGCERFCSYCVVPLARGKPCSEKPEVVVQNVERAVSAGYREVVLTGTDLGSYGVDLPGNWSLPKLLEKVAEVKGLHRVRLSSIEPFAFCEELFDVLRLEVIAPHFHIPLQSGSDRILLLMRRRYTAKDYAGIVEKLLKVKPGACIGTDVMVGFPTETQDDFLKTALLVKTLPISYLHIFPYSPRKRTRAYSLKPKVPAEVVEERVKALKKLAVEKNYSYRLSFLNKVLNGVVLHSGKESTVLTENYIKVKVGRALKPGEAVNVRLVSVGAGREENYGELVG
jgi:threonylcarbamoyladenosine tRNA methylthiotransferase MtaB